MIPSLERRTTPSTVDVGAARLRAYATPDTGRTPVVFLHAGVCDSRMWHHEIATLGPSRRVVAFDRRGYGESKAAHEPYDNVADTIAVMDATGVSRAVLVGCSMGGRLALDVHLAHPDRVAGLVLVCAGLGGAPDDATEWQTNATMKALYARWLEAERAKDHATIAKLLTQTWLDGPLEPEGRVGGNARALFDDMLAKTLVDREPEDSGFDDAGAYASLSNVMTPTLVVWGPLDVPDVTRLMRHAAATIPGAQTLEVDGTAHLPNLERPEVFTPRLVRFVEAID